MSDLDSARTREASASNLGPRRSAILRGIVLEFVDTAEPVGSKHLQQDLNMDVSSATIRNDMAVLEQLGLIFQPFTSAGRVPTDRGFRTFVDELMEAAEISRELESSLKKGLRQVEDEDESVSRAQRLARLLSGLTEDVSFVLQPTQRRTTIAGLHGLLQEPEAKDLGWVSELFRMLEDPQQFTGLLLRASSQQANGAPVRFVIGSENDSGPLQRCTLVLSSSHDPRTGEPTVVGFVGPTRIDYRRTASFLRALATLLE